MLFRSTLDKYTKDTSVDEMTELVVAEYRQALRERHEAEGSGAA